MADETRKVAFICSKGNLGMAYPALVMGWAALGNGVDVSLFFTFWGLDMVTTHRIDKLQLADRTATGEAIFTALQAIATVGAVIGGGNTPPPARIVLMSDGKETVPSNPDNPKGAFTAARTAKDQGVPISTVSFGTPYGYVEINNQRQPVPVDDETLKKMAELSGGNSYSASSLQQLKEVFTSLQDQIGYETVKGDASTGWLRLGSLVLALAALAAVLINRRLPG